MNDRFKMHRVRPQSEFRAESYGSSVELSTSCMGLVELNECLDEAIVILKRIDELQDSDVEDHAALAGDVSESELGLRLGVLPVLERFANALHSAACSGPPEPERCDP